MEPGENFIFERRRHKSIDTCALSDVEIPVGAKVVLLFSNFKLFPNRMVLKSELDKYTPQVAIQRIRNSWNMAQKYKHWFV